MKYRMMKNFFLSGLMVVSLAVSAQPLTGIKTIPGDYPSIANAINVLNTQGTTAPGVTFNIASGYTENGINIILNTTTSSASAPVVFRKVPGGAVNPKIIAFTGVWNSPTDGAIIIAGSDYITFDGIDITANDNTVDWGYGLVKKNSTAPFDGCQNVTIRNCTINMVRTGNYSYGIYAGNHTAANTNALNITATGDACNSCKFYNNTINNTASGIFLAGFTAPSPYSLYDQGNEIGVDGANIISGYGGSTSNAGICVSYQNNITIANNTISSGANTTGGYSFYGINLGVANQSNATVTNNNITINMSVNATPQAIFGIYSQFGGNGTSNTVAITNNTISNCTFPNSVTSPFYGICNSLTNNAPGNMTIQYNTLHDISMAGSGYLFGIDGGSAGTVNMNYNTIYNLFNNGNGYLYALKSYNGTTNVHDNQLHDLSLASGSNTLYGLYEAGSPTIENYYNNGLYNFSHHGTGSVYGMYLNTTTGTRQTYANTIHSFSSAGGLVCGMMHQLSTPSVYRNSIYDLTSTNASGQVYGIYMSSGSNATLWNNYISDLKTPAATGTNAVVGIYVGTSNPTNLYYNSIFLNASSSSATTFGSSGIYLSSTFTAELKNNIVVNNSTPVALTAPAYAAALARISTVLTGYAATSNNNCYYSGTPGANKVIYFDGTNTDQSISLFKQRVTPRETGSVTEMPPFADTLNHDLHLLNDVPTLLESSGTRITSPVAIQNDADNAVRWGETGYAGTGTSTDIGAHEGNFTPAGTMTYTGCTTTQVTGNTFAGTANQAIIRMKISVSGGISPFAVTQFLCNTSGTTAISDINATVSKIYYTGNSPVYGPGILFGSAMPALADYTISGTQMLTPGDNYFWLVADVIQTAQTGHLIDGQCNSITIAGIQRVPAVSSPDGNLNILGPMSGTYLVGAGNTYPDFTTLTEAANNINHRGCGGAVTIMLTNNASTPYNSANGEVFPITFGVIPLASATNSVLLRPSPGMSPVITGLSSTSVLFFNGTDYFTLDGSNSGTSTRDLLIENTSTGNWVAAVQVASLGSAAGANFLTFKNNIIRGGGSGNQASYTYAFSAGSTIGSAGYDNDNMTITNNEFSRAYYAVYLGGMYTSMDNLLFTSNTVGSDVNGYYVGNTGLYLTGISGTISGNTVKGIIGTATTPTGIYAGAGVKNTLISKNDIHAIKGIPGQGYCGTGISVDLASLGSNVTIANNILYDITGDGTSNIYSYGTAGIKISGISTDVKVYYNSICLSGMISRSAASNDISAAIHVWTSATQIDIRNNIFSNSLENTTGVAKAYGIYSDAPATAFTNLDYNNYFITGREAVFGYIGGSDKANLAAWQSATGKDANSITSDPAFNSPSVLVPYPGSPALDRCPALSVTDDYLGTARPIPTSMGAYETGKDITPPIATYTPLPNTSLLTPRVLTATITDAYSTVPNAGTGLPRLYWRINNNPYTPVTGTWISGNTYQFTLGNFAQPGNSISYFIVCQDNMPNPNVGATPSAGATGFGFDPPSCITAPSSPSSYQIVTAISGIKNIPGDYPNLTGANGLFADLNNKTLNGNLTVNIVGNTLEDGLNALNEINTEDAAYHLTIQNSGTSHKISGSYTGALIRFNGADNVTINGKGKLAINNTNALTSVALQMSGGCNNNTIDSCAFATGQTSYTYNYGIYMTGVLNNNKFRNDSISKAYCGIYIHSGYWGNATGNIFTGNVFGSSTLANSLWNNGIMAYYQDNMLISRNTIFNIQSNGSPLGIYTEGATNTLIERNDLHDIVYNGSSYYGSGGITIWSLNASPNVIIRNNLIRHMGGIGNSPNTGDYNDIPAGIKLFGQASSGIMVYNNSVYLIPDPVNGLFYNNEWFTALEIGAGVSGIILKNNILQNSVGEYSGKNITSWGYGVYCKSLTSPFSQVNNNLYYVSNYDNNFVGLRGTVVPPVNNMNLAAWQSFTGQDSQSLNTDPLYTSTTNLTPQPVSPAIGNGAALPGVVDNDFYGNPRGTTTTIGAIEMVPATTRNLTISVTIQGLSAGNGSMNASRDQSGVHWGANTADHITIELHDATPGNYQNIIYTSPDVSLGTNGLASTTIPAGLTGSYYITIRHRNGLPTVSSVPVSFAGAYVVYYFDAPGKAYGNRLIALPGGGYGIYSGDLNQDGAINDSDISLAASGSATFTTGYVSGDVNGDGTIDSADMTFIDNNRTAGILAATP